MVVGTFAVVKGEVKLSKQIGIYRVGRLLGADGILRKYAKSKLLIINTCLCGGIGRHA